MVDNGTKIGAKVHEFDEIEIADKDTILHSPPIGFHRLVDSTEPFVIADVISHQVSLSSSRQGSPRHEGNVFRDLTQEVCPKHTGLDLKNPSICDPVSVGRMGHFLVHPPFISSDEGLPCFAGHGDSLSSNDKAASADFFVVDKTQDS